MVGSTRKDLQAGTDMIQLIIGEHREVVWTILRTVLSNEPGIELWRENPATFSVRRDFDAFIVMNLFAFERLGYPFGEPGQSRVLSAQGDPNMPPWIVTTPNFRARLVFDNSDTANVVLVDPLLSPAEEVYDVFAKVFGAIEEFNRTAELATIERLGCDLEFIRIPITRSEVGMRREIESIRRAYRELAGRAISQ